MSTPRLARLAGGAIVVAIALALAAGALGSAGLQRSLIDLAPFCPFLAVTGLPCPFCGMTRATFALGSGDLRAALSYHPLSPLVLAATLWGAYLLARGALPSIRSRRVALVGGAALAAVWIGKLASTCCS